MLRVEQQHRLGSTRGIITGFPAYNSHEECCSSSSSSSSSSPAAAGPRALDHGQVWVEGHLAGAEPAGAVHSSVRGHATAHTAVWSCEGNMARQHVSNQHSTDCRLQPLALTTEALTACPVCDARWQQAPHSTGHAPPAHTSRSSGSKRLAAACTHSSSRLWISSCVSPHQGFEAERHGTQLALRSSTWPAAHRDSSVHYASTTH
jgi:hypothetical protein